MATTFTRVNDSDALAGKATNIKINELGFFSLTAVRTGAGNLKLINWRTGGTDGVARLGDSDNLAGEVSEIALTRGLAGTVTAVRTGSGKLKLISWDDGLGQGPIQRLADSGNQAGEATLITVQPVDPIGGEADLVTAVRTGAGKLKLIAWEAKQGGPIKRLGDSGEQAGKVKLIALSMKQRTPGVPDAPFVAITAVRTASGNLKLIAWGISPDGTRIDRLGDSGDRAGAVSEIAIAETVTAVRTGSGNLKLISWNVSPDGKTIQRLGDREAGEATKIAISRFSPTRFVTAVRAGNGRLKLIAYDVSSTGTITRTGDSGNLAGAVSDIALATPAQNNLVTAVRDGSRNLFVISWRMEN
jgi:hypothetical protein